MQVWSKLKNTETRDNETLKLKPHATLAVLAVGVFTLSACGPIQEDGQAQAFAESQATSSDRSEPGDDPDEALLVNLDGYDSYGGQVEDDLAPDEAPWDAPTINTPDVEPCPYGEEVSAVEGAAAQVEKALELGCEMDVLGGIDFTSAIDDGIMWGLISPEHAINEVEMCQEGYIDKEYCDRNVNY